MEATHLTLIGLSTFNIRNTTDRYDERAPFLLQTAVDLLDRVPGPHLMGLQEVAFEDSEPIGQSFDIVNKARDILSPGSHFHVFNVPTKTKFLKPLHNPTFRIDGNSTLVANKPVGPRFVVEKHEKVDVSDVRAAQRLLVRVEEEVGGVLMTAKLWFVNTHLHHELQPEDALIREEQVRIVLDWMDASDAVELCSEVVFVGDFNAPPNEPAYALLTSRGYHSAHHIVHGVEPKFTFPTGLQAPTMDTDPPVTTDYIFSNSSLISFLSVELCGKDCHPNDPTMFPSDHMALVASARIELSLNLSA